MNWFENITGIITTVLGLPIGALGLYLFNLWQAKKTNDLNAKTQNDDNNIKVNDQALNFYRQFVEQFLKDFHQLEKDYFAVKEELINLKAKCKCPDHDGHIN